MMCEYFINPPLALTLSPITFWAPVFLSQAIDLPFSAVSFVKLLLDLSLRCLGWVANAFNLAIAFSSQTHFSQLVAGAIVRRKVC
eukprot:m.60162 g.60162  ORF g.60162 m.60162 type:complete len:85 (-) comp9494_c0_seq1:8044-8298(-)